MTIDQRSTRDIRLPLLLTLKNSPKLPNIFGSNVSNVPMRIFACSDVETGGKLYGLHPAGLRRLLELLQHLHGILDFYFSTYYFNK